MSPVSQILLPLFLMCALLVVVAAAVIGCGTLLLIALEQRHRQVVGEDD